MSEFILDGQTDGQTNSQPAGQIVDITVENFMSEVMEASQDQVVILQFWAPWCGPCKQLGPVLEKVVAQHKRVKLARVNIDDNQEIAMQLRVQSVPTVYGFVEGRPADGFAGAQPESAVRQFVEKLVAMAPAPADIQPLLEAGQAGLDAGDGAAALEAFQQALAIDETSQSALAGMVRALIVMGALEDAEEFLAHLDESLTDAPVFRDAAAALELAKKTGAAGGDIAALADAVEKDGADLQARQDYAMALFSAGQSAEAMGQLLLSLGQDAEWNDGAAKAQLLEFFAALGPANPDVLKARRKLSSLLFS